MTENESKLSTQFVPICKAPMLLKLFLISLHCLHIKILNVDSVFCKSSPCTVNKNHPRYRLMRKKYETTG